MSKGSIQGGKLTIKLKLSQPPTFDTANYKEYKGI